MEATFDTIRSQSNFFITWTTDPSRKCISIGRVQLPEWAIAVPNVPNLMNLPSLENELTNA